MNGKFLTGIRGNLQYLILQYAAHQKAQKQRMKMLGTPREMTVILSG